MNAPADGGPASGMRVVEIGSGIAVAVAGMLLADYGAEVLRLTAFTPVESEPGFLMWHRGKRLDPHERASPAEDLRYVGELLAEADLCLIGPGRDDLDAAVEDLAAEYPGVVILRMPPYEGPPPWGASVQTSELLAATMGLALRQSSTDGGPIHSVYPQISYVHAVWAATCAVAALLERNRSGAGQVVTVTGAHAALVTGTATFVVDPDAPAVTKPAGPGGPHPMYTTYECSDGEWLFLGALTGKFQARAVAMLGLDNLIKDERLGGALERSVLPQNRDWVRDLMAERFARQPRQHWLDELQRIDCPAGPVCSRDGWLDTEQLRALGQRIETTAPDGRRVVTPGLALDFADSPGRLRPAQLRGEHDPAWPERPALPVTRPASPTGCGGPLAGLHVLDMGTVLAGPLTGSLLAELGADVVKVEPLEGDPFRVRGFVYNRGMRSIAIDLRHPQGHDAMLALADGTDVVIDNYRLGVLARLGIDRQSLAAVKPDIVSFSLTGFGDRGPWRDQPGFDPVLQAMSGMMRAQGGEGPPVFFTVAVNDICAAVFGALASVLGVWHRDRTGEGQAISTSLAAMSVFMQSGELIQVPGGEPSVIGGPDFRGPGPLNRYYRAADGWVRAEALEASAFDRVAAELHVTADELEERLALHVSQGDAGEVVRWLQELGVPAVVARRAPDLITDPALSAVHAFVEYTKGDGRPYWAPGPRARFSRTQKTGRLSAPGVGEHCAELLRESGLAEDEIKGLFDTGVIRSAGPFVVDEIVAYR